MTRARPAHLGIAELRFERRETLGVFARRLGLRGAGHLSEIERGETGVSLKVAIQLERLSHGKLDAATLNADVAAARAAMTAPGRKCACDPLEAEGDTPDILVGLLETRRQIADRLARADRLIDEKAAAFARERGIAFIRRETLPFELSRAMNEEKYLARQGKAGRDAPKSQRRERAA